MRDNLLACHTPLKIRDVEKESKPTFVSFASKSFHQSRVYFLPLSIMVCKTCARSPNNMADFIATFTHRNVGCLYTIIPCADKARRALTYSCKLATRIYHGQIEKYSRCADTPNNMLLFICPAHAHRAFVSQNKSCVWSLKARAENCFINAPVGCKYSAPKDELFF